MTDIKGPVSDLDPKEVFLWFEKIAQIPHGSGKEERLSKYLRDYAHSQGFETEYEDTLYTLLIRKPASHPSLADKAPVILQSHLDMVCNSTQGYDFDFENDPIKLCIVDGFVQADRTTLGADDGIGVAYSMALLDAKDISHPPLELVFTTQEETGMHGAKAYDVTWLKGTTLINIDSEEENVFCSSCACGTRIYLDLPIEKLPFSSLDNSSKYAFFSIEVSGLAGGHSGIEIHKERGNANRLLGRILADLAKTCAPSYLAALEGGVAHNAIPSAAKATVCVYASKENEIRKKLEDWKKIFVHELAYNVDKNEPPFHIEVVMERVPETSTVYAPDTFNKALAIMTLIPHGVETKNRVHDMPETSSNFAMIREVNDKQTDKDMLVFATSIRSSMPTKRQYIEDQIRVIADLIDVTPRTEGTYPAWEYEENSAIRQIFLQAHRNVYSGKEASVQSIHAGLECGIFASSFAEHGRKVDMIAFGPTIFGAHSPTERVNIESVKNTWILLKEVFNLLSRR